MTKTCIVKEDGANKGPEVIKGFSNALHENHDAAPSFVQPDKDGSIQLEILPKDDGQRRNSLTDPAIDHDSDSWMESEDDDDDDNNNTCIGVRVVGRLVSVLQSWVKAFSDRFHALTRGYFMTVLFAIAYLVYFIIAMRYRFDDEGSYRLLGCTILGLVIWSRHVILRLARKLWTKLTGSRISSATMKATTSRMKKIIKWALYVTLAVVIVWTIVDEGMERPQNLRSVPGLICFLLICLLFSSRPSKINWHTVYWSLGLQFMFALYALRWRKGKESVIWVQDRLDEFFANSKAGSILLFGETYTDHQLIFGALPTFLYLNATIYILYFIGAMQFIVRCIGNFLNFVLDTSPVESISVASGIFLEGLASIALLRPYMGSCTKSQLFLIMTSTFASLGGAYLALLSSISINLEFLIAAMVISAPATFTVCKLLVPETRMIEVNEIDVGDAERKKYANLLDAAQTGAVTMLTVVGHAAVSAFSFWSFISWINSTLTWFGDRVGIHKLTMELISSYVFYPVSLAMGIELEDCRSVGMLLGYRVTSSNLVAFIKMMEMKVNRFKYQKYMQMTNFTGPLSYDRDDVKLVLWNETLKDGFISERSEAITIYSLTGFSSLISAAILLGIMFTMVPKRKRWIAKATLPALVAGNIANCMTGCFASLFYQV